MTNRDRDLLRHLSTWDPPEDPRASSASWEEYAEQFLNQDLPQIGAFHEQVRLAPELSADIAVPTGVPPFPVVLYLHGGGWAFGSPKSFRKVGMTFALHGCLTVNLDYRLAPEHPFPEALDDVRTALEWIESHVANYGGDPNRVAVGGDSAGANLALAAAIRGPESIRAQLSALLLLYGPYDLAATVDRANHHPGVMKQIQNYIGGTDISAPLVSPLRSHFPASTPPCFLLEGGADEFVRGEAAALAAELQREGITHELQIIDHMPHGFTQFFQLDGCQMAWKQMIDFLRRQTHNR